MFLRVIFHVGMKKTGSSSIQNSLASSSDYLESKGFYFPCYTKHSHQKLFLCADGEGRAVQFLTGKNSPAAVSEIRERSEAVWARLGREIEKSKPHTIILSSEYAFGLPVSHLQKIISRFRKYSDDIHVIGYLREPSALYLSATQQLVKYGHKLRDPFSQINYEEMYKKTFKANADKTTILPFRRDVFLEGCIVQDFLARFLSLSAQERHNIPTRSVNESISAEGMELMRSFNTWRAQERRIPGDDICKILLSAIRSGDQNLNLKKPVLLPLISAKILRSNADGLSWLKENADLNLRTSGAPDDEQRGVSFDGPNSDLRDLISINEGKLALLRGYVLNFLRLELDDPGQPAAAKVVDLSASVGTNVEFLALAKRCQQQNKSNLNA
jgi:hypothetical protein